MKDDLDPIGGRALEHVLSLPASTPVGVARAQVRDWVLVTHADEPVALVHRGALSRAPESERLADVAARSAGFVKAQAGAGVQDVLASRAVGLLRPAGIVVFDGPDPRGVWAEDELLEKAAGMSQDRFANDTGLPGQIDIAKIVRRCRHSSGQARCSASITVDEKPDPMPACADPDGLGPHSFEW
jgi:hypothetical protein